MGVIRPRRTDLRGGHVMITRARRLRANLTDAERALWRELRQRQLGWRFRRQFPIPPYVVDFACIEARLLVEADGGQHALSGRDRRRDARLRALGWRVLRFWNNDILQNRAGVLQTIAEPLGSLLLESDPHPNPPPLAGEGVSARAHALYPPVAVSNAPHSENSNALPPPHAGEGWGGG